MNTTSPSGGRTTPSPLSRSTEWRLIQRTERRVLDDIRAGASIRPGERVLVGVSGGPDSTALLLILSSLKSQLKLELTVVHVDHGVRPSDVRAADAAYVRGLSERAGVPFVLERAEPKSRSEAALREARYAALGRAAMKAGASCVALGHTMDDQAETVLMRLIRGAGVEGLGGMQPRAPWPAGRGAGGPDVARPLLGLRRVEVHAYVAARGETPLTDETNVDPRYARNRVRAEVLPALLVENPRAVEAIARAGDSAREAADAIAALAEAAWSDVVEERGRTLLLRAEPLVALATAVRHALVSRAIRCLLPEEQEAGAKAVGRIDDLLAGRTGRRATIAGRLLASRTVNGIRLAVATDVRRLPDTPLRPGTTQVGPWVVELGGDGTGGEDSRLLALRPEIFDAGLFVRSRRPGDRIRLPGGTRKVQDVLVDAKVPSEERDEVPIVCDAAGRVLWVVGYGVDPKVRADDARGVRIAVRRAREDA